ncbi:EamA-like transporter family protein [Rubripirellula lacrimiformis]|uniref:EamA-like transporter family protein n=1 Tax=Rubripirellula lacrimiformis TaxID=1930273 RepID=A0A517NJ46_9BACT|nr:DMT family transporter [Rubripirellula lacrimiformis]QDT07154.1 EamA-like transporter family protein [Rubripirellula lacrimiformis]
MGWIALSVLSAIFLGFYDIAKKSSVRDNAVPIVLLLNVVTAALVWLPAVVASSAGFDTAGGGLAGLTDLPLQHHGLLMAKSLLVGTSWTLAFFAMKQLPISIATPIRATSPIWTIAIAVLAMGERPSWGQWGGIAIIVASFTAFSRVGKREGIRFHRSPAVLLMIAATLLGAVSSIYDKYLLQSIQISPSATQAWFSIYLVPVMLPLAIRWWRGDRAAKPFQWRWSIPLIAVFLLIADWLYFTAVSDPDALISVISPVRRTSVIVSFLFGILRLGELNWQAKLVCIGGILAGVFLISQG